MYNDDLMVSLIFLQWLQSTPWSRNSFVYVLDHEIYRTPEPQFFIWFISADLGQPMLNLAMFRIAPQKTPHDDSRSSVAYSPANSIAVQLLI